MLPFFLPPVLSMVQTPAPPAESRQFDFWIGEWTCTGESYDGNGKAQPTAAENTIRRTHDGHVIQEDFRMPGLQGLSVSVYDAKAGLWKQTWVDNQGGYIDLQGGFKDGRMVLQTLPKPKAPAAFNRMVFRDIAKDSFDWDWEASADGGKTWTLSWHLHYRRKGSPASGN